MAVRAVIVLCPTRGRPREAGEMVRSFRATAVLFATDIVLVVDRDDPAVDGYRALGPMLRSPQTLQPADGLGLILVDGGSLTAATNEALPRIWDDADIIGHVGDDHRFVTPGWDRAITQALEVPGVAYGDDGYWHERIPTAWFVSASIVRSLGWLALPTSNHYGIDNAWRDIGEGLGRLTYLPDVHISHPPLPEQRRRPDAIYRRAQVRRRADSAAYYRWRDEGGLTADLGRIRA